MYLLLSDSFLSHLSTRWMKTFFSQIIWVTGQSMKAVNERFKRERELIRASKLASRVFLARNRANLWLHRIVLPYRKFIVYASACTSALFLRLFWLAFPGLCKSPPVNRGEDYKITFHLSCFVCNDHDFLSDSAVKQSVGFHALVCHALCCC